MINFSQYGILIVAGGGVTTVLFQEAPKGFSVQPNYRFSEAFLNEVILSYTGFLVKIIVFLYI